MTEMTNNELASAGLYEWLKNRDPQLLVAFHEEAIESHRSGLGSALEAWDEHVGAPPSAPSAAASAGPGASSAAAPGTEMDLQGSRSSSAATSAERFGSKTKLS